MCMCVGEREKGQAGRYVQRGGEGSREEERRGAEGMRGEESETEREGTTDVNGNFTVPVNLSIKELRGKVTKKEKLTPFEKT